LALAHLCTSCQQRTSRDGTVSAPARVTPAEEASSAAPSLEAPAFVWLGDEEAALAQAKREKKRLLIDFGAKWCAPCVEFETITFADPRVQAELRAAYVGWKLDVTEQTDAHQALQKKYRADRLPQVIALDPSGRELVRWSEFVTPDKFLGDLHALGPLPR